jgi:hypothetical protein
MNTSSDKGLSEIELKVQSFTRNLAEIKEALATKYMTGLHSITYAHWRYFKNGDSLNGIQELWIDDVMKARITVSISDGIKVEEYE